MKIQISDSFTYKRLLIFTLPSIFMMIFTSIYTTVDGFFISNFVGDIPFAAVNFIFPFLMLFVSIGFMLGSGGSALIAKTLGEGDSEKANRLFSLFVYVLILIGVVLSIVGIIFIRPIAIFLGASDLLINDAVTYGRILLSALPFWMLQFAFQTFFVTAGKPNLGFISTVCSGVTNMVLDALLVAVLNLGVVGAGVATAISQVVGGVFPLIYFSRRNDSLLKLTKTNLDFKALGQASYNGVSEFLSSIASSVAGMLYNAQLMRYAGENGVSAYGTIMYVSMLFFAVFIGFSMGTAPIVSYNYGAKNQNELKSIRKKSLVIISIASIFTFIASILLARPLATLFVGYNQTLSDLTVRAFNFYSFTFLFAGLAIYGSSFFTALNNGFVSALISFLRVAVFQVLSVLILPLIFKTDGIWVSCVVGEFFAFVISILCLILNKKRYGY